MKNKQTTAFTKANIIFTDTSDILLVCLSPKNRVKPASVQNRILRRIFEKRRAQVSHRIHKVIVPKDLEPLNWGKNLDSHQKAYNFAS